MSTIDSTSAFHDRLNLAVGDTSYRQLGSITETHPETVRRYMQGQAPSAAFMTNLCQNLGISGEWLLSGQGPMRVRDIRTHALKNADANELMGAIANTLTQLIERVDRLERFVQIMETRLNASGEIEPKPNPQSGADSGTLDSDERPRTKPRATKVSTQNNEDGAGSRIAGAIAKRASRPDA